MPEAVLQIRQHELTMEGVDGGNVGENVFYHLGRK